jgi:hypothetical protein
MQLRSLDQRVLKRHFYALCQWCGTKIASMGSASVRGRILAGCLLFKTLALNFKKLVCMPENFCSSRLECDIEFSPVILLRLRL